MSFKSLPETGYVRLEQIIGSKKKNIPPLIPVSRATVYKWISEGKFPPPEKPFGYRISLWNVKNIRPFLDSEE